MKKALLGLGVAALAACGTDATTMMMTAPDGGSPGDDGAVAPGGPPAFPQVTAHSVKPFASPQLVTITYADFTPRDKVEQFGDFLVGSQWWGTVGAEYGVGKGVHLAKVRLGDNAPTSTSDGDIVKMLEAAAKAGTIPAPSSMNDQLVYLVYFPSTTKVDEGDGSFLCGDGGDLAYHYKAALGGVTFEYAVLPDCDGDGNPDQLDDLTSTASHEIVESATDPVDGWYLDVDASDLWYGLEGEEVADLCEDLDNVAEGGWALQRSWSNAAAMKGTSSPCVPIPAGEIFTDVTAAPAMTAMVPVGGSATFTLTGWAAEKTRDWTIDAAATAVADFDPGAKLTSATMNDGLTVKVTLTVPSTAGAGDVGAAQIFSASGGYWPVTVIAE